MTETEKRPTFFFCMEIDGDPIACLGSDLDYALRQVKDTIESDLEHFRGEEEGTYRLAVKMMTKAEEEALPEL